MHAENITKKQHFVPQFYLRKFLSENVVHILDLDHRAIIQPRGTKGLCYEEFFYAQQTGQQDDVSQKIEKYFCEVENNLSKVLKVIIPKLEGQEKVTNEDKYEIALLMSMFWIRGINMRAQINDMQEQIFKHINQFSFSNTKHAQQRFDDLDKANNKATSSEKRKKIAQTIIEGKYSVKFDNTAHLHFMKDFPRYANLFYAQDWIIHISKAKFKFITSDNPLTMVIPPRQGIYPATFLERPHFLSLTPEICIETRYSTQNSIKTVRRKTYFDQDAARILRLNLIIANHAHEYIYSNCPRTLDGLLRLILEFDKQKKVPSTSEKKVPGVNAQ